MTKLYGLIKKWKVIVYSLSLENYIQVQKLMVTDDI